MRAPTKLIENNRAWAQAQSEADPEFFTRVSEQQHPEYLWIGCSDSRVPASQILDLGPGEVFVHRNIANVVSHSDLSCLSAIEFAVSNLKVKHIIVCGHHGCGGVAAAARNQPPGLIDDWLQPIRDVREDHSEELAAIAETPERSDRLSELNVIAQVQHVYQTATVQRAWEEGHELAVHGWIYRLRDGLIQDLNVTVTGAEDL